MDDSEAVEGSYLLDPDSMERGATFQARLDLHKGEASTAGTFTLDWSGDGGDTITRSTGTWKRVKDKITTTVERANGEPVPAPIKQTWSVRGDALHLAIPALVLKKQGR